MKQIRCTKEKTGMNKYVTMTRGRKKKQYKKRNYWETRTMKKKIRSCLPRQQAREEEKKKRKKQRGRGRDGRQVRPGSEGKKKTREVETRELKGKF